MKEYVTNPNHSVWQRSPTMAATLATDSGRNHTSQKRTSKSKVNDAKFEALRHMLRNKIPHLHMYSVLYEFSNPVKGALVLFTWQKKSLQGYYPMIFRGEPPDPLKESSYKNSLMSLEHSLDMNPYAAGKHLTLADFSIVANISLAEAYNYNFRHFPNIVSWLRRLKSELPFYREINEIPLMQFKFWYRPFMELDDEEMGSETETNTTKM
ncbi:UNVERIFIED_CONTAM: GstD1 [Trichonephila clavipes]